ncbi:MAG: BTAD domain-containing putative transcriptional regulator [Kibdelosporangium sp.]
MLFRVLGPLETCSPDGPSHQFARKPATLLASLLAVAGQWVSCEKLIDAIWNDRTPPVSARSNIKSYVWQLRRDLPPTAAGPRIEARAGAYRVCVDAGELDVDYFEQHMADARKAMATGDLADVVRHLTLALELWRSDPFPEIPTKTTTPLVAGLTETRFEAREMLAVALAGQGHCHEAIADLRELTVEDPLREAPWAQLVRTLHQAGRRNEALVTYEHARAVLKDELGVEPGPELVSARREVMAHRQVKPRCELPRDVPDFTGRTAEVARLRELSRTAATGVPVAVIDGAAGVGKTALATHVAHRIANRFPDGQLFLDLGQAAMTADRILARLLRSIGVPDRDIPADTAERAAMWRAELAGRRLLLVVDDARGAGQIQPLLPGSPGCMVLVTTSTRMLGLAAVDIVSLGPLGFEHAAELFLAGAGDWRMGAVPDAVSGIVHLCGGVPAAIRAAATDFRVHPKRAAQQLSGRTA